MPQPAAAAELHEMPESRPTEVCSALRLAFIPELANLPSRRVSCEDLGHSQVDAGRLTVAAAAAASLPSAAAAAPESSISGFSQLQPQPQQQPAPAGGPAVRPAAGGAEAAAGALPVDRMQTQSKYQAALLRLRQEPGWLGSAPAERQEAFEALWGQFSIKQWQERSAAQVRAPTGIMS